MRSDRLGIYEHIYPPLLKLLCQCPYKHPRYPFHTVARKISQNRDSRLRNAARLLAETPFSFCFVAGSPVQRLLVKAALSFPQRACLRLVCLTGVCRRGGLDIKQDTEIETLIGTSHICLPYFRTLRLAPLGYEYGCNSIHRCPPMGFCLT